MDPNIGLGGMALVGGLIRQLRFDKGDTLRQAAERTGVSFWVIHRLENNKPVLNRETVLEKFARGYGVDPNILLQADTPKGSFRARIAQMPLPMRASFIWSTFERRLLVALDFAASGEGARLDTPTLAQAAGMTANAFHSFRLTWRRGGQRPSARRLAQALMSLLDLPVSWFASGTFANEPGVDGWHDAIEWVLALADTSHPGWEESQRMQPINVLREMVEGA